MYIPILQVNSQFTHENSVGKEKTIFEILDFEKGQEWNLQNEDDTILFILSGQIGFSFGKRTGLSMNKNEFFLIPIGFDFAAEWKTAGKAIIVKMQRHIDFGKLLSIDLLLKEGEDNETPDITILPIRNPLDEFIRDIVFLDSEGLNFYAFMELKYKELFFLFWGYYTKKEMHDFFYLHFTDDFKFSEFVLKNYRKVKAVNELAVMSNYSISGFSKRFKKVFGKSPYQWMQQKRSEDILFELLNTEKNFKEICDEYNFTSPSHLNEFCKSYFGHPPGVIRRKKNIFSVK